MAAPNTSQRIALALILGGLLLASPPATSGGLLWDIGIGSGYISVVLVLFLYLYPLRGDGLAHRRLIGISQHRTIGWWMLAAAALHVVVLLGSQTSTGRYLLPSAPLFMLCGVAALVIAAILVQTGLSARSAIRGLANTPGRIPSRATLHIVLAATMVLTLCAHLFGSAQLVSGPGKTVAICLLLALPLAWFAFRSRPAGSHQTRLRRATCASAAALIPLLPSSTASRLLLEPAARPSAIPTAFPHDSHTSVNCIACHHNFVDHTGVVGCIDCHRTRRPDLGRSSEATFHTFCRDCHTRLAADGARHGPTRACSACHSH